MANVLVVEDDPLVSDMLRQVLTRARHVVNVACDGEQAWYILEHYHPDIIVTDILMPKKSGTTLISEVKQRYPRMEIIAISAGARSDPIGYLDLSEDVGPAVSFAKPVDHDALLMTIDLLLSTKSSS